MKREYSRAQLIMTGVIAFYLMGTVLNNIITIKTVPLGNFATLSCGLLLSPIVFACNDILTECMGEKFAFKTIMASSLVNLWWSLVCVIVIALPGTRANVSEAIETVLGSTWRVTVSSFIAYVGGGYLNNLIMTKMRQKDGENKYYLRAILSSAFGQLLDNYAFRILAFAPIGLTAVEFSWDTIMILPLVTTIAETVLESFVTPISKKICTVVQSENE